MKNQTQKNHNWGSKRGIWALAVVLALLFIATLSLSLWEQSRKTRAQAVANAKRYTDTLAEFRTIYTSEVVATIVDQAQGRIQVTHDYREHEAAIPLPATLSLELGSRITEQGNASVALYSPYPFPWRKEGGLRDDFAREAWMSLRAHPEVPYYRFVKEDDRTILRYATADRLRPQCVNCHNTHPQTPQKGWKEGDVRGVLEASIPMENPRGGLPSQRMPWIILPGFIVASLFLVFIFRKMQSLTRLLEERVKSRTSELEHVINVLDARNQDLGVFARTLAHDLRSPLSTIQTLSDVLVGQEEDSLSDDTKQTVHHIQNSSKRLMTLVDGIKSLATVGRDLQPPKEVDLNTVLQDVIAMLDTEVQEHNAKIEVSNVLPTVSGHVSDITTLILNLVQNAIRHHPGPNPKIWVQHRDENLMLRLPFNRACVVVSIEDDGDGVPKELWPVIFHPFARGPQTTGAGQGIGLSVAQRVMDHLEGRIWVEDRQPKGARFCIAFPIATEKPS